MADVAHDGTRAREGGATPRRGLPVSGRLIAAITLIGLSGLMLVHWLTYSVPKCTAAPAYIQNVPPSKSGVPDANPAPAPEVSSGSDGCAGQPLFSSLLPSASHTTASLVSDARGGAPAAAGDAQAQPAPPQATPAPSRAGDDEDRPNFLRRFFRWLLNPFRRQKSGTRSENGRPVINSVTLSKTTVELCDEGEAPTVAVTVSAGDANDDRLAYEFSVDSGRVITAGPNDPHATWDLSGSPPGVHKLSAVARAEKSENRSRPYTAELKVSECGGVDLGGGPCDYLSIDAPRFAPVNGSFNLTASFGDYNPGGAVYAWKVSPGRITAGQGEQTIRVATAGLNNGQFVNAEVSVRVAGRTCERAKHVLISIARDGLPPPPIVGTVLDWEGNVVPGAKVRAFGDSGEVTTNTDERGEFRLSVPFGKYELEATALGCTQRVPYEHSANRTSAVVIRLEGPAPTPSPKPTPTPSPSPSPVPSPSPDESPTPEPSPVFVTSQAPSPTPTGTPVETPTPAAGQKRMVQDKITVERPERFLEGKEDTVKCELAMVYGEVIPTESFQNGVATAISKPNTPEGGKAGPLSQSFGENYTSFAQFSLESDDLDFTSESPAVQPVPADVGQKADWAWKVRLKDGARATASFTVRLDVVWRPKTRGGEDIVRRVWERKFVNVPVGLPPSVKLSKYGFPLPLSGGLVALGVAAPLRRRRSLEELAADSPTPQLGAAGPATPEEDAGDEVTCSVFSPREASPGDSFLVQVFAHLAAQADQLPALARQSDQGAEARGSKKLDRTVERGTELSITLFMPGFEIDQPSQSFVWDGEINLVPFGVTVPEGRRPGTVVCTVSVCQSTVPIGHIKFVFRVTAPGVPTTPEQAEPAPAGDFVRYRQAFISYASADRAEVLRRVQMLALVKLKYFQDLLDIEPGQQWEPLIYRHIDESDVFFLFWSKAARESGWVEKEVRHALSKKGERVDAPPEIVPVIIEGPPLVPPPPYLADLHFNDKFLYFIRAEDEMKGGCGPQPPPPAPNAGAG